MTSMPAFRLGAAIVTLTLATTACLIAPARADDPVGRRVAAETDFRRLHMAYSVNEQCGYVKGKSGAHLKDAFYRANTEVMLSGAWDKVQYQRYFSDSAPILSRVECRDPLAKAMVRATIEWLEAGGR